MRNTLSRNGRVTAVVAATALVGAGIFVGTTTASASSTVAPIITKLSAPAISDVVGVSTLTVTGKNFTGVVPATDISLVPAAAGGTLTITGTVVNDTTMSLTLTTTVSPLTDVSNSQLKITRATNSQVSVNNVADNLSIVAPIAAGTSLAGTLLNPLGKTVVPVVGLSGMGASAAAFATAKITATVDGDVAPVAWVSATSVNVTAPAGTPSNTAVNVVLYRNGVAGGSTTGAKYAAVISKLSRTSGGLAADTTHPITVTGKGFTGATAWAFGSTNLGVTGTFVRSTPNTTGATCVVVTDTTATCTAIPAAPQDGGLVSAATAAPFTTAVSVSFTPASSTPYATTAGATYLYSANA
jgi:hypothetical protein